MSRIISITTVGWLVAATATVIAQQPRGTTAAVPRSIMARNTPIRIAPPKILPGTRPDVFSFIQGNALTSTNGALANVAVRLRDARVGQIIQIQLTDQSGLFAFPTIDPGSYIVEIMSPDQTSGTRRQPGPERRPRRGCVGHRQVAVQDFALCRAPGKRDLVGHRGHDAGGIGGRLGVTGLGHRNLHQPSAVAWTR